MASERLCLMMCVCVFVFACVCVCVCVREGSPQSSASYYALTFMSLRLTCTVVTDLVAARRKSNYYSGVRAAARPGGRRSTAPSKRRRVSRAARPSALNRGQLRPGRGQWRLGPHLDLIGDKKKLSRPEKRLRGLTPEMVSEGRAEGGGGGGIWVLFITVICVCVGF